MARENAAGEAARPAENVTFDAVVIGAGFAGLSAPAVWAQSTMTNLRVGVVPVLDAGAFFIAQANGYFAKERLDVAVTPTPGGGRPPGARDKFGLKFLQDVQEVWAEVGKDVLYRVAQQSPAHFLRSVVILQRPTVREIELERMQNGGPIMTEQEIRDAIVEGLPTLFPDLKIVERGKLPKR